MDLPWPSNPQLRGRVRAAPQKVVNICLRGASGFIIRSNPIGFLAPVPFLLAGLLAGCGKSSNPSSAASTNAPIREVRVARAELRPMERVLTVVGTLSAREEATVSAQVAGQIEQQHVDVGDQVQAGQEVALIDTTAHEAFARQAAANVARAQAAAANAEQNLKRIEELQQARIASGSELDQAVALADQARADVKAVEAAEAVARLNLDRSRVKAPFAGTVAERIASVGDYVAIGTPIIRLVQADPLRLRLDVPERESGQVRVGQTVRVTLEGDTNTYTGRLARIAPAIRASNRMLAVEADVPNPGGLRAGLFARAHIVVDEPELKPSIPADALLTFAGLEKVVLVKDGKAQEATITTGRRGPDWVEIVSGLPAGELVVRNPAGLRTGQALMIAGDHEAN